MAPLTSSGHPMNPAERKPPLEMLSSIMPIKHPVSPARSVVDPNPKNPNSVVSCKYRPYNTRARSITPQTSAQKGRSPQLTSDVAGLQRLPYAMQATLGVLGSTFEYLGEQTEKLSALESTVDIGHQVHQLRRQAHAQDRKHEERTQEIKSLLQDSIKEEISEHLRAHVLVMIREKVNEYASQKVKDALAKHISEKLRQQMREHCHDLAEAKRCLHNSESRHANSRSRNHGSPLCEPLYELLMADGTVSELWPRNLAHLFGYSYLTARRLLDDYELTYANDDPTERMLNKFMKHIGVGFTMIPIQRKEPI